MNTAAYRLVTSLLFIIVLLVKVFVSVSPAFSNGKNKTVMQLEQESKNDKEDPDNDASKDKKKVDDDFVYLSQLIQVTDTTFAKIRISFRQPLYRPNHHASVSTPPPDNSLV